jgi:hypothetical protein
MLSTPHRRVSRDVPDGHGASSAGGNICNKNNAQTDTRTFHVSHVVISILCPYFMHIQIYVTYICLIGIHIAYNNTTELTVVVSGRPWRS